MNINEGRKNYMGKDLNGNELGENIKQRLNGSYEGRYVDRHGNRRSVYSTL